MAGIAVLCGEKAANEHVDNGRVSEIGLAKKFPDVAIG